MVTKSFTQALLAVLFGGVTMLHAQEIRPIAPNCDENVNGKMTVSYTHLTLPTTNSV